MMPSTLVDNALTMEPANATTSTSTSTHASGNKAGSDQGQVGKAPTTIREAVEAVLMSADPSKTCSRTYVTQHYLQVAYGGPAGCATAPTPPKVAKSLRAYQERASGDHAVVTARPSGGIYNGERIAVSLVRQGPNWKVDSLKSNAPVGP
jgi:hypothetical protein